METEKQKYRLNVRDILLLLNTLMLGGVIAWLFLLHGNMNFVMSEIKPKLPDPETVTVNLNELSKDMPVYGNPNSKVTLVLFNSFTCGYCFKFSAAIQEIQKNFQNDVKLVYRHYIRTEEDYKYAQAAQCAADQNKFWEMYRSIFDNGSDEKTDINKIAELAGLNIPDFKTCLASKKDYKKFDKQTEENTKIGISGTPSIIVNDQLISGAYPYYYLKEVIEKQLKK